MLIKIIAGPILIVLCALINSARGGRFAFVQRLPGHSRLWAGGAMLALTLPFFGLPQAAAIAAGYLIWSWLPWGHWYDLGYMPPIDRPLNMFERVVDRLSWGDKSAFLVRNCLGWLPSMILVSPLMFVMPFFQQACYESAWDWRGDYRAIAPAEYATGACLGSLLWVVMLMRGMGS